MSNVAQQNILDFDQDTYISFKGYEFNINDQKWVLDINKTLNINKIWNFEPTTRVEVIQAFEPYRVCRRPLFLRECPDEKSKIHP